MNPSPVKRSFPEMDESVDLTTEWKGIHDLLLLVEEARKAELETMASVDKLHGKIIKGGPTGILTSFWF